MKLTVINSGSSGNLYLLKSLSGQVLVLECGEKLLKVKESLNFDLSGVVGALSSHVHLDHSKYINEFTSNGIKVYSNKSVVEKFGGETNNLKIVEPNKQFNVGSFSVIPFLVRHDPTIQTYGFLIFHEEMGKTVFLTDLVYSKYTFKNISNWIVEANYCDEKVKSSDGFLSSRILNSHLSVQNCIKLLQATDLSHSNNICLIHLSDSNSNAKEFKQKVTDATGKLVTIAEPNLEINFNKFPF
jgi:phosphoribosyl 1,2-cyclic phosphodiesterase